MKIYKVESVLLPVGCFTSSAQFSPFVTLINVLYTLSTEDYHICGLVLYIDVGVLSPM